MIRNTPLQNFSIHQGLKGNLNAIQYFLNNFLHSYFVVRYSKILLFILINLFAVFYANAQWQLPCQDSMRKNTYFQCNEPYFKPVCGCTNKTYRNECVSYNVYGVNVILSNGVCQAQTYEFDFYPNPATEQINFAIEYFDQGNMTIQIFDSYGKLMYFMHKANVHRFDEIISVSGFKPGMYVVSVISGSKFKAKKLIVK